MGIIRNSEHRSLPGKLDNSLTKTHISNLFIFLHITWVVKQNLLLFLKKGNKSMNCQTSNQDIQTKMSETPDLEPTSPSRGPNVGL